MPTHEELAIYINRTTNHGILYKVYNDLFKYQNLKEQTYLFKCYVYEYFNFLLC